MMKPKFQSCWVRRSLTTDSTRSSPTSSPAAMVRRTTAPTLVWFCTFQRKMSPTLMCTMSRSAASSWLWVPLPLPCTPMITYLRMSPAWHTHGIRILRVLGGRALAGIGRTLDGLGGPGFAMRGPRGHGRDPEPGPRPRPQRGRQVQMGGDGVRGRLVVHSPAAEMRPRLVRRPLEFPARLGYVPRARIELLSGQDQRIVRVRVVVHLETQGPGDRAHGEISHPQER